MQEDVLHFIWQHQYYKLANAFAQSGELIQVLKPGIHNNDAGPDFEQVKLKIGDVEWNGDVEIHVKSSDWNAHKHQLDKAYNKVVLHIVWKNDREVEREDGTILPTLVLEALVDETLLKKAHILLDNMQPISCSSQLQQVPAIIKQEVVQRALVKRLERKATLVLSERTNSKGDWEEVAYRLLMKQMGMKVNGQTFYELAVSVPYKLIKKYSTNLFKIEALLFGMSGLLKPGEKGYPEKLKEEFSFLAYKHSLSPKTMVENWKFMRLRPSNFPTLRLAQVAALLANSTTLFALFMEEAHLLKADIFETSTYWKAHYRFNKEAAKKVPKFGVSSIDLLKINVVAPLLMAYGLFNDDPSYIAKALALLETLKPEHNKIIAAWQQVEISPQNGGDAQGLIELYNESCLPKKCLNCGIGFNLLKT
ncbi:MAG: DUF2851 family protein [Cyclobacteriaceae bacterium]|nr:DUF2851 family protein [Cyclobacteriaceae bacterium]